MNKDSLIDFNSPVNKRNVVMLDPLVPLPQVHRNNIEENVESAIVGENPFDSVILQLCKLNDPFEVAEKLAFEQKTDSKDSQSQNGGNWQSINNEPSHKKEIYFDELQNNNIKEPNTSQLGITSRLDSNNVQRNIMSDNRVASVVRRRSLSESCLSPIAIEKKFSKLYLSAQLDKQLLDESSTFNNSVQDLSICDVSKISVCDKSERSLLSSDDLPKTKEEVKAYVANRIEKCIEKALNESRISLNGSFRHKRSLSAGNAFQPDGPCNYSSLKPSYDSSMCRNRSFSNHDLYSSLNVNPWRNDHGVLNWNTRETLMNTSSRFNTAFRKSTATSSMFTSYGQCDIGFLKSRSSLPSNRPSSSSFATFPSLEAGSENGNNSVFLKDDAVNVEGNYSSCVYMEAKNLSLILETRSRAHEDEPLEADMNFLSDPNFKVELVDSDSSLSENDMDVEGHKNSKDPEKGSLKLGESSEREFSSGADAAHLPLSRDAVASVGLVTNRLQAKKLRSSVFVPPPVPLPSAANSEKLVLKPRSQSDSKVGKRGPMKAVIPLGNMMRNKGKIENGVPSKQTIGRQMRGETKSLPSANVRKSAVGDAVQNHKVAPPRTSRLGTPGAPVACSTPGGALPLVSPTASLQLSGISRVVPADSGRRRSKSEELATMRNSEMGSVVSSPVTRKSRHVRSKSGAMDNKQPLFPSSTTSPNSFSPSQVPVSTSTPLKAIAKNTPPHSRVKKSSPINQKLQQRSNHRVEKENLLPRTEQKHQSSTRSSSTIINKKNGKLIS